MDPWQDPEASDSALILGTLFEVKAQLVEIGAQVTTIRWLLDDGDDGEEEEETDPES